MRSRTVLPLPKGEGRGEGKRDDLIIQDRPRTVSRFAHRIIYMSFPIGPQTPPSLIFSRAAIERPMPTTAQSARSARSRSSDPELAPAESRAGAITTSHKRDRRIHFGLPRLVLLVVLRWAPICVALSGIRHRACRTVALPDVRISVRIASLEQSRDRLYQFFSES